MHVGMCFPLFFDFSPYLALLLRSPPPLRKVLVWVLRLHMGLRWVLLRRMPVVGECECAGTLLPCVCVVRARLLTDTLCFVFCVCATLFLFLSRGLIFLVP
jgi:hypothetical protein